MQAVADVADRLSRNAKTVNYKSLMMAKPRGDILKANKMYEAPAALQARVLVEGHRALNEFVINRRVALVSKIREFKKGE